MLGRTLNLGILAHVDAGKTTLTERLLYDAGVIAAPGSVDRGTTQTDTLALERARGITIKAAVVSFPLDDITINIIDTPGHPDFIAEVERALAVLDGAVLVLSAVEGVQAQSLVLMRALQRLRIPTLLFVNKTDRGGADVDRVLGEISARLTPTSIPAWEADIRAALAEETRQALVYPVFAGSAMTGEGLDDLRSGIAELLPAASAAGDAPLEAAVFKVERVAGEKVAYVRVFAGAIRVRERIGEEKVTALEVFERGRAVRAQVAAAGQIGKVWGLRSARIGDRIGAAGREPLRQFAPPTLEAVVEPLDPGQAQQLRVALDQLAEQDPLIGVRQDEHLSVSIYGEVQKEVLEATLAAEYDLAVAFRDTTPIHVERPRAVGEGSELLNAPTNPFHAQLGVRIGPGDGVDVRVEVADHTRIPLYVYKRRDEFDAAMDAYVRDSLRRGLYGWEVIDCAVTVFDSWYSLADGPPSRRGPTPTAADFRGLTPIVVRQALERAGTVVCEPVLHVRLEIPADTLGAALAAAGRLGATLDAPQLEDGHAIVDGTIAALHAADLQRQLPGLTRGEGVLESSFAGYRPVTGEPPTARR